MIDQVIRQRRCAGVGDLVGEVGEPDLRESLIETEYRRVLIG